MPAAPTPLADPREILREQLDRATEAVEAAAFALSQAHAADLPFGSRPLIAWTLLDASGAIADARKLCQPSSSHTHKP